MRILFKLLHLIAGERGRKERRFVRRLTGAVPLILSAALWLAPATAAGISGTVADARYPYGALVGIAGATVAYGATSTTTDTDGSFRLDIPDEDADPVLDISAVGYVPYRERLSRMVAGAFHLIPNDLYRGVYLVAWQRTSNNPNNWLRKWEQQTEFVIVRSGASEQQIRTLTGILADDEYRLMTGGRFKSRKSPTIVDSKPSGSARYGKTVISFASGISGQAVAHSEDSNGIINYAEITWNVSQQVGRLTFWHEMVHTATTGGEINEWPSVVSEVAATGYVTKTDEEIFNCIYNSPPRRETPAVQPVGSGQPVVNRGGVLSNASYLPLEVPNSGIAQGSVFAIFGRNLGAAGTAKAEAFPLPTELAGTSVRVTVEDTSVDAYLLYTTPTQVGALLPSRTPAGRGTLTLSYGGQTSSAVPIQVVPTAFGIFTQNQAGTGPAVAQIYQTQETQPMNSLVQAAAPAQVVTLWGTGLGPVQGDEAAGALPGRLDIGVEAWVGGKPAKVIYAGRSGCCAGIDQVVIEVPPEPAGCYVPVVVRAGGVSSNFATLSLAAKGKLCTDPMGFSDTLIGRIAANKGVWYGVVRLETRTGSASLVGAPPSAEWASATFKRHPVPGSWISQGPLGTVVSRGQCLAFTCVDEDCLNQDPAPSGMLDTGTGLDLNGPAGAARVVQRTTGVYRLDLDGFATPTFLSPGAYTVSGTGGARVGSFTASLTIPAAAMRWTSEGDLGEIDRAQPFTMNWVQGDADRGIAGVMGQSVLPGTRTAMTFLCLENTSARQVTIPPQVLDTLPPGRGTLSLIEIVPGLESSFSADGIDAGYFFWRRIDSRNVSFK